MFAKLLFLSVLSSFLKLNDLFQNYLIAIVVQNETTSKKNQTSFS